MHLSDFTIPIRTTVKLIVTKNAASLTAQINAVPKTISTSQIADVESSTRFLKAKLFVFVGFMHTQLSQKQ